MTVLRLGLRSLYFDSTLWKVVVVIFLVVRRIDVSVPLC
jgi:hypothetical protein